MIVKDQCSVVWGEVVWIIPIYNIFNIVDCFYTKTFGYNLKLKASEICIICVLIAGLDGRM
jgi:hypothetical protein